MNLGAHHSAHNVPIARPSLSCAAFSHLFSKAQFHWGTSSVKSS